MQKAKNYARLKIRCGFKIIISIGRWLDKVILKEYRDSDGAPYIFTEDPDGSRMKKLVNDLVGLVNRMKDDEKVIYNCSY